MTSEGVLTQFNPPAVSCCSDKPTPPFPFSFLSQGLALTTVTSYGSTPLQGVSISNQVWNFATLSCDWASKGPLSPFPSQLVVPFSIFPSHLNGLNLGYKLSLLSLARDCLRMTKYKPKLLFDLVMRDIYGILGV